MIEENANGTAGASARREHERRKTRRESGVRERHPRIGGVILALQDAPQHETSWERGGGGEEVVAQALAKRCPQIPVLHDRRIPGSPANIDHIGVAATGCGHRRQALRGQAPRRQAAVRQADAEDRRP